MDTCIFVAIMWLQEKLFLLINVVERQRFWQKILKIYNNVRVSLNSIRIVFLWDTLKLLTFPGFLSAFSPFEKLQSFLMITCSSSIFTFLEFVFSKKMEEKKNEEKAKSNKKYICKVCNAEFKQHSSHSRHQGACGKGKQFDCANCEKHFNRKDSFKRHLLTCKPKTKEFDCERCGKSFDKNWKKLHHMKDVDCTKIKTFQCKYCQ